MKLTEKDYQHIQETYPSAYAYMIRRDLINEVKTLLTEMHDGCKYERETWIRMRVKDIYSCTPEIYTTALDELANCI